MFKGIRYIYRSVLLKNMKIHEHESPDKFYYHGDDNDLTTENAYKCFDGIKI